MSILVPLLLIPVAFLYIRLRKKSSPLRDYIDSNLKKGYTKEQIRNALLKNGYSSQQIEKAFRAQPQQQKMMNVGLRNYPPTNLKKGYTKEQIKSPLLKNRYAKDAKEEIEKSRSAKGKIERDAEKIKRAKEEIKKAFK